MKAGVDMMRALCQGSVRHDEGLVSRAVLDMMRALCEGSGGHDEGLV